MKKVIFFLVILVMSQKIYCQTEADFFARALDKEKNKNYKGAIRYYTKALKLDSTNIEIWERRGFAKSNLHLYPSAILDFEQLIKLNPNNSNYYYVSGVMKYTIKDYKNAIIDYTKAIDINPEDANLYSERGRCKFSSNDFEGAFADFTKSLMINPNNSEVIYYKDLSKSKLKTDNSVKLFRVVRTNIHKIRLPSNIQNISKNN
jgi:tetratricopeptide (TPR) repeat protein